MSIKIINKSGNSRILRVESFAHVTKIAYRFERWEYVR